MAFGRILVAVDFEPSAARAVEAARALAAAFGGEVSFVHVLEASASRPILTLRDEALRHLAGLIGVGGRPRVFVEIGHPAVEIVRVAIAEAVELIVIGAQTGPTPSPLLGSVTDAVARRAPCAVLIVR